MTWAKKNGEYSAQCKHCGGRIVRLVDPEPELFQDDKWRHVTDADSIRCTYIAVEQRKHLMTEPEGQL